MQNQSFCMRSTSIYCRQNWAYKIFWYFLVLRMKTRYIISIFSEYLLFSFSPDVSSSFHVCLGSNYLPGKAFVLLIFLASTDFPLFLYPNFNHYSTIAPQFRQHTASGRICDQIVWANETKNVKSHFCGRCNKYKALLNFSRLSIKLEFAMRMNLVEKKRKPSQFTSRQLIKNPEFSDRFC